MKPSSRLVLLLAAAAFAAAAQAQLKPTPRTAPAAAPAQAAPAAGPAIPLPSVNTEKENAGRLAAHGWLVLLDRRDWGTAWDASSAVFRQNVPLGNWMDAIPKLRQPLGNLVERQQADLAYKTTLAGRPDGEYVTVIFVSKFEKQAEAVEEVVTTVLESDGKWRVTGYSTR
jgi:hypothetical protein